MKRQKSRSYKSELVESSGKKGKEKWGTSPSEGISDLQSLKRVTSQDSQDFQMKISDSGFYWNDS